MKKNIKKNLNKNFINYMVLCFLLSLSLTVFSGCKKENGNTNDSNNQTILEESDKKSAEDLDTTKESTKTDTTKENSDDTPDLPETKELLIYGMQNETLESEQVSVTVPKQSEITAEFIVGLVVDVFADNSLEIGIDSVTEDGDKVIVSFQKDKAPLINVGSGVEITILDSISMSLLDNLDTCKNVIFRVEGEAYASGHVELGIDEVYKWK
jgi:hypothetical protein